VAELADALDSKSSGLNTRAGSTPAFCTKRKHKALVILRVTRAFEFSEIELKRIGKIIHSAVTAE
jgi:hypothetical protein